MAENVRVVIRCRPMNKKEHESNSRNIVTVDKCSVSVTNPSDCTAPAKTFTFDSVYGELERTELLYNEACYSLVDNVLEGYNGTIFAYGQTGCGKTFTMQHERKTRKIVGFTHFKTRIEAKIHAGRQGVSFSTTRLKKWIKQVCILSRRFVFLLVPRKQGPDNSKQRGGIITCSFDHIFEGISVATGIRYLAMVSFLEIYNENIRDLLNPYEDLNANHALKEQHGVGVTVPTLSTHTVVNAEECYHLLNMGNRNRVVGATLMNASSSRSHSIFTISLEQIPIEEDSVQQMPVSGGIRRGKLNLVDLAGSERQNKTGAVGERLREATKINLSLSALGNVISALVDGKTKHIPYRDSKLTRLLQDSLGGNTKTLMIACISPADSNYDETISTLRYASRAKNISNKPKINEDPKDAKLREYQEEIIKLKTLLKANNSGDNSDIPTNIIGEEKPPQISLAWLDEESKKLNNGMQAKMERLREEHIREKREKEQRIQEMEELTQNYEEQLKRLKLQSNNSTELTLTKSPTDHQLAASDNKILQLEACKRIEMIKQALIGGERANDTQLKEKRQRKKLDAQRRLSALAHVLSRVEQSEDRDILQGHYTSIQQELNAKNEHLKLLRQKNKALEREVSDLQVEFQLDRADYLETIRRLEKNLKFYQQIMDKALPILRKDGKYWNPDEILQNSQWNDELKVWRLPETTMDVFKLPLASSLRNKQYLDNAFQKRINSSNSLQSSSNGVNFVPVDYVKETTFHKHIYPKRDFVSPESQNSTHSSANFNEEEMEVNNNNDFKGRTIYALQNYDHIDLDKSEILQNYFRSNRRKHTGDVKK